jgi:hypothetical protein
VKYRNLESDQTAKQEVIIGNRPHGAWRLDIPSLALDEKQTEALVSASNDSTRSWIAAGRRLHRHGRISRIPAIVAGFGCGRTEPLCQI